MSNEQERILIKTQDGKNFQVDYRFKECCKSEGSFQNNPLAIQKATGTIMVDFHSDILSKAVEFLKMHEFDNFTEIPKPLPHCRLDLLIKESDFKWVSELNDKQMVGLFNFSRTLIIEPLFELLAAYMASLCRGKDYPLKPNTIDMTVK